MLERDSWCRPLFRWYYRQMAVGSLTSAHKYMITGAQISPPTKAVSPAFHADVTALLTYVPYIHTATGAVCYTMGCMCSTVYTSCQVPVHGLLTLCAYPIYWRLRTRHLHIPYAHYSRDWTQRPMAGVFFKVRPVSGRAWALGRSSTRIIYSKLRWR